MVITIIMMIMVMIINNNDSTKAQLLNLGEYLYKRIMEMIFVSKTIKITVKLLYNSKTTLKSRVSVNKVKFQKSLP